MGKNILFYFALFAAASARIRTCDRGVLGPEPQSVRITNCVNNEVCRWVRGTNMVGLFDFTAQSEVTFLRPELHFFPFDIRGNYTLESYNHHGCDLFNRNCPLPKGSRATFIFPWKIIEELPLTLFEMEYRLFDQDNNIQFCIIVETEIVLP